VQVPFGGSVALGVHHLDLHIELAAQLTAVGLVVVRVGPQPVVDVQGAYTVSTAQGHGNVEQTDRVAPAGEHRDYRGAIRQEPPGAHLLAGLGDCHVG
jgi:hypothetical protein